MKSKKKRWLEQATTLIENIRIRKHFFQKRFEAYFDQFTAWMVYGSIVVIILESDRQLNTDYILIFNRLNFYIYLFFTIEYIYKHFWSTKKFKSLFSIGSILELIALSPFFLPLFTDKFSFNPHLLRLIWVFKIFNVPQYRRTTKILGRVIKREKETLRMTISLCFALTLVSSVLMWTIESEVQPEKFTSIFATMWWSVATLTTVGYGDIYPITPLGKTLAAFTAILGIGIFVIPTGVISAGFMREYQSERSSLDQHSDNTSDSTNNPEN